MTCSRRALLAITAAFALIEGTAARPATPSRQPESAAEGFAAHTIDTDLAGGYQVVVADLNRDGKPDIIGLASGLKELRWYENPGWQKHVLVTGINQPINAAAHDVDGDGIPEIALAHGFSNVYARSAGILSILTHQGDSAGPWSIKEIDRVPTSHRLRFADITGTGSKVLVNFPLIGSQAVAPDYRDHVALLMYRPGDWKREVITDAEEGVVHGILATTWADDKREALLSASFLGISALQFEKGAWTRVVIVKGDPGEWPKSGSSDVAVGRLGGERFLAAIEPWHGNKVAIYRRAGNTWTRHVIDETIGDGHTIVAGDFDADGRDEVIVGERQGKRSVYLYRVTNVKEDTWSKTPLDEGGMAGAGCAVADLNADGSPDVACIGTATANLKWYENRQRTRKSG
jgi:Aldos-2-ulose dehydratase, beta-propeller domain/FG-GAP-like repeat